MNKLSILSLGALALMCACNSKPSDEYTIKGTTDLADGEMVYMVYLVSDSTVTDSVAVANGAFTFTGKVEKPHITYINNGDVQNSRIILLEPGETTIALTGESYKEAEVNGSFLTQQMDSLNAIRQDIYSQMNEVRKLAMECQDDTAAMNTLSQKYTSLGQQDKEAQLNYVKTHTSSLYAPYVMAQIKSQLSLDELKEIYNSWSPEVQASDEATGKYIVTLESLQPGAKAPEIVGNDINGNAVTLEGLKGKVVLLDFWATWCGPCRASLPHVKEVFEKYHDKGLEVVAISLDRTEEPWKEYIAESGMGMENYINIYDAQNAKALNAENYAIQYIPSKFIIDAEGVMVGRFDNPAELDAKLAEMLGE